MATIRKNLAYNFLLSVSQVLLPLISVPYISRVLDPGGIGVVSFIDSFTWYFVAIAEFGIVVYGMREVARTKENAEERSKLVSELLALHILSSAVMLVLYAVSVYFVWDKIRDVRLLLFSLSFLLVNFFACEWYFLGMERFRYITMRSLLVRALGLISIFLLIKSPDDYFLYYGIMTLSAIAISVWNNILLFRGLRIRFRKINFRQHIRHTRITYLISLTYSVTLYLDNVLLGLVSTTSAVAFYAFAMKIVRTAGMLLSDTLLVYFPRIAALQKQADKAQMQHMIMSNLQLLIFFAVPLTAGLFLLAEPLVRVFLGEQFMPAAATLRLLAFFPLLRSYNLFLSKQILVSHNQERRYLIGLSISSALLIPLTLVLSYYFADIGAGYAVVLSECVLLMANLHYARKTAPDLRLFDGRAFMQACLGAGLFIPVIVAISRYGGSPAMILVLSMVAGGVIYFGVQLFVVRNAFSLSLKNGVAKFLSGKKDSTQ